MIQQTLDNAAYFGVKAAPLGVGIMFFRVFRGAVIGLLAAVGCIGLGYGGVTAFAAFGVPLVVSLVDVLVVEVFTVFTVFGIGALLWAYTPIGAVITKQIGTMSASKTGMTSVTPDPRSEPGTSNAPRSVDSRD
jgi:hypothetical protein